MEDEFKPFTWTEPNWQELGKLMSEAIVSGTGIKKEMIARNDKQEAIKLEYPSYADFIAGIGITEDSIGSALYIDKEDGRVKPLGKGSMVGEGIPVQSSSEISSVDFAGRQNEPIGTGDEKKELDNFLKSMGQIERMFKSEEEHYSQGQYRISRPVESTKISAIGIEKQSLKDAEDKILKILENMSEPEKNLMYQHLYNSGLRIEQAETIVRRNFKV